MIVSMNERNSDGYIALFTEAYNYLRDLDKGYVDENKERFGSLAEYYSHMADFFENQKYKYVMLPIEEEPFKIDLNTRNIEIPQSFAKCASVQSDQLAETIIFVVDRYFDYMDLANTHIYVQWTIPENKKTGVQEYNGATQIEMIDLETESGKIKFAWPLNDQITAVPGSVKFSVRFFRLDDSAPNKLLYSLNTTEKEIIIKEALQPTLTSEHNVESPISDNSFKKAILNSLFATEGVVPPVQPAYMAPGSNIDADTMMEVEGIKIVSLDNDTITLKVQAIVADAGDLTYKWYYKNDNSDEYFDCEKYPVFDEKGAIVTDQFTTFGSIRDVYIPFETQPTVREPHERYYVDNGNGSYNLYVGAIPADEGVILYEKYSTFTVPASGKITGYYQAAAWNNIAVPNGYSRYRGELTLEEFINGEFYVKNGAAYEKAEDFIEDAVYYVKKVLTTLHPTYSSPCLLPAPMDIMFKADGNLMSGNILVANGEEEDQTFAATLSVNVVADSYNPTVKYEWRKSLVSEADAVNLETAVYATTDANTLEVSEPGWYSVNVVSELNRTSKNKLSHYEDNAPKACKVTHAPEPPVVEAQPIGGSIVGYVNKTPATFKVTASIHNPDEMAHALLSDNISYIWQIAYTDTNETYINIPEGFAGVSGLGTNAITVTEKLKTSVANFRCLVINELNGARAIFDHSGSYASDGTLGDFKAEAPYIYEDAALNYIFTAVNF